MQHILQILVVMPFSFKTKILSIINQTQDEGFNINDNFWAISTLQDNKKL